MKLTALLTTLLLAGCTSYGSWLDHVGKPPNPPREISEAQARQLTEEAAALRGQAEAVRLQLAAENDRHRRFVHYRQLRRLGEQLATVERLLHEANRPSPISTAQPVARQQTSK